MIDLVLKSDGTVPPSAGGLGENAASSGMMTARGATGLLAIVSNTFCIAAATETIGRRITS
ncbi:MAG: hypothetical protein OXN84_20020 [Albidovulum sp.]|nr:hypothetical protein [Albidovulum sp.]